MGRGKTRAIWRTVEGVEQRRCPKCGEWVLADKDHFYHKRDRLLHCRPCGRETVREYQRTRYVPSSRSKEPMPEHGQHAASALESAMKVKL